MGTWWPVSIERVHAIRFGDEIHVGDCTLTAVAPPLFDTYVDGRARPVDGGVHQRRRLRAILPEPTADTSKAPPEALVAGMLGWATSDSPWAHVVDAGQLSRIEYERFGRSSTASASSSPRGSLLLPASRQRDVAGGVPGGARGGSGRGAVHAAGLLRARADDRGDGGDATRHHTVAATVSGQRCGPRRPAGQSPMAIWSWSWRPRQ
jgi:hypothetical protein